MNNVEDEKAADAALEADFEVGGRVGFLSRPYHRYRYHNGFLAGCQHARTSAEWKALERLRDEVQREWDDEGCLPTGIEIALSALRKLDRIRKEGESG